MKGFKAISHGGVDPMHDMLESLAALDIIFILNYCIDIQYFCYEILCARILGFDYGHDYRNKPLDFSRVLKDDSLKLSASEMLTDGRYLPLIIGDLIPEHDEVCGLFLLI